MQSVCCIIDINACVDVHCRWCRSRPDIYSLLGSTTELLACWRRSQRQTKQCFLPGSYGKQLLLVLIVDLLLLKLRWFCVVPPPFLACCLNFQQEHGKIKDMFSGPYRRLTIHLFIVWFGMTFGYYGVVLGSTEIVERTQMCDLSGVNL